ncbi:hypothetical protein BC941DRAFT_502489 [Chlamydoabsidia padenii]|nr:hypothetical protein BC941DRAFT_502489 [Chlamydoabsidia padenii]
MKLNAIALFALSLVSSAIAAPLNEKSVAPMEERSTTKLNGNKVSVVSGIIITNHITQCFQYSGVEIAKAYAAAVADQWNQYLDRTGGTYWISSIEAQWASGNTQNLYCSTFDATYTFATAYSAQVFANWVRGVMGTTKRDDKFVNFNPDVYVSDVDLPANHPVFGSRNATESASLEKPALGKRNWASCSNAKCGFSFSTDQTGICRDTIFPSQNSYYC